MSPGNATEGFVLAGTRSGVGKTVATLATIHALEAEGHAVQPAKAGPDFIDPSHHRVVADRPSRTLDVWMQGEAGCRRNYHRGDGDVCPVEGVMGLYDGDCSSTAMVAAALDVPVVLVADAKAGMESVAATALGFRTYADRIGRDIDVAGVLVQRAHGGRHERGIREALPDDMTYFGRIPPLSDLEIPDRHLGLHMGSEAPIPEETLAEAAESIHADRLIDVAGTPPDPGPVETSPSDAQGGPRVAVARDEAFCFYYPNTIERLRAAGSVETFSPVAGDDLPDADAVYLPGGYPELHAEALGESETLSRLADRAAEGVPVLGECGGFMALAESLTTADGTTVDLAGVLPADVRMHDRYQALDHVELAASGSGPFDDGDRFHGHEFHYSSATVDGDATFVFDVERGDGISERRDGLLEYRTVGTYAHCHAASGLFEDVFESSVA